MGSESGLKEISRHISHAPKLAMALGWFGFTFYYFFVLELVLCIFQVENKDMRVLILFPLTPQKFCFNEMVLQRHSRYKNKTLLIQIVETYI